MKRILYRCLAIVWLFLMWVAVVFACVSILPYSVFGWEGPVGFFMRRVHFAYLCFDHYWGKTS